MDDARGQYTAGDETIFDDLNVEQAKAIPPTALHRNVDLQVLEADQAGYIRGLLVIPPTIYGTPTHPLVSAGISNTHSIQIPVLIKAALDRKKAGMVGAGKPVWPSLHIDDSASHMYALHFRPRHSPPFTPQPPIYTSPSSTLSVGIRTAPDTGGKASTSGRTASTAGSSSARPSARPSSSLGLPTIPR